jgi:VIT1/CCC1 family predicted Fe2+/Mn2+ transporter
MAYSLATAIRDYEYLKGMKNLKGSQASERRRDLTQAFPELAALPGDPFNSRYCTLASNPGPSSDPLRDFLKIYLPRQFTYTKSEIRQHTDEYLASQPPDSISPFVDKLARFIVAFMGGASLVVPVLVMSLPTANRTKSLITVSVTVTIFASLMSLGIRATNSETLVATATYAAVLVVFVGTSI